MSDYDVTIKEVMSGLFTIVDNADGTKFEDAHSRVRTWHQESKAIGWIRSTVGRYNKDHDHKLTFTVRKTDGVIIEIGSRVKELSENEFGPHDWQKNNLVTISDRTGLYDLMKCRRCGKTAKRYDLGGVMGGVCPKNPITAGAQAE